MSLHISATTGCNLGCSYCYENPDRERKQEWVDRQYDIDEIMKTLKEWNTRYPKECPGLHGGEPLLIREEHLEKMFSFMYDNWDNGPSIQTNGTLINDEHIRMFNEYGVNVGVSCDGPVELNKERKAAGERGSDESNITDRTSERLHENIEKCIDAGVDLGIITVLHETNAGDDESFEKLLDWLDWLNQNRVSGHFNPAVPYEDPSTDDVALSGERLKECYLRTWEWMKEESYRSWGPMRDYVDNLLGNQVRNCVNNKCDPANAGAAKIITGDGETTGCGKTWGQYGDGSSFLQGPSNDSQYDQDEERYEVLKQTPGWVTEGEPDMGGCKGCKYWNVCRGGCPGAGQDDDYRNRTHFCQAKYALYEKVEHDLRALLPNIRLITDLPWDAEVGDRAYNWQLDIKPFAAMRPGVEGASAADGAFNHDFGSVRDQVPDEAIPNRTWEETKDFARSKYDEAILTFDDESHSWHADSHNPDAEPPQDDGATLRKVPEDDD